MNNKDKVLWKAMGAWSGAFLAVCLLTVYPAVILLAVFSGAIPEGAEYAFSRTLPITLCVALVLAAFAPLFVLPMPKEKLMGEARNMLYYGNVFGWILLSACAIIGTCLFAVYCWQIFRALWNADDPPEEEFREMN